MELLTDLWGEKKDTLLKNGVIEGRRNREKKEKRGRQREKSVGREEARGGGSEGVRREKKQKEEKKWESLLWERLNEWNKILFLESKEDNIYRNYTPHERERLFSNFLFFGKQPIENKPYFYKSFPLTKFLFFIFLFFI